MRTAHGAVLKDDFHMFLCKDQVVQEHEEDGKGRWVTFCNTSSNARDG